MSQEFTSRHVHELVRRACAAWTGCREELNELDARLGDGDLGTTLASIAAALPAGDGAVADTIGEHLSEIVRVVSGVSGSSFTAVVIAGLRSMAKATQGRRSVPFSELPALLRGSIAAMSRIGGAQLGDKTLLDGLAAVADALEKESDYRYFAVVAHRAAEDALLMLRDRPCRIGRARIAGDRSAGADDPGMVALGRVLEVRA